MEGSRCVPDRRLKAYASRETVSRSMSSSWSSSSSNPSGSLLRLSSGSCLGGLCVYEACPEDLSVYEGSNPYRSSSSSNPSSSSGSVLRDSLALDEGRSYGYALSPACFTGDFSRRRIGDGCLAAAAGGRMLAIYSDSLP